MYKIFDITYLDEIKKLYEINHVNYDEIKVLYNLEKGYLWGEIKESKIINLIIGNEREAGFDFKFFCSDNFDLEKSFDFLNLFTGNIILLSLNKQEKDFFVNKNFIQKDTLIKYLLSDFSKSTYMMLSKVDKNDLDFLTDIDDEAFGSFWKQGRKKIEDAINNKNLNFYKYVENDKILAYIIFNFHHIFRVAVSPKHQGKGIGKNIMIFAINKLKKLGTQDITLYTQISNEKSRPLYENLGFKEIEISYILEKVN